MTYPVLADVHGEVTPTYTNWFGVPLLPWVSIVSTEWVLCYSDDAYDYSGDSLRLSELVAVFDSLFAPEIGSNPISLDFGGVGVDTFAQLDVVLSNIGTGLLNITDISVTLPVFSAAPTVGQVYAVDDSLIVTVTFAPQGEIIYDDTLWVYSADDIIGIYLHGQGTPVGVKPQVSLPRDFGISCYPNPFNGELTIQVRLENPQEVEIGLYNVQGGKEEDLWRGLLGVGAHELRWSDPDAPSGLYLIKVAGEGWSRINKVVLIR